MWHWVLFLLFPKRENYKSLITSPLWLSSVSCHRPKILIVRTAPVSQRRSYRHWSLHRNRELRTLQWCGPSGGALLCVHHRVCSAPALALKCWNKPTPLFRHKHHSTLQEGLDGRCSFTRSVQGREGSFAINTTRHNLNLLISETHSSNKSNIYRKRNLGFLVMPTFPFIFKCYIYSRTCLQNFPIFLNKYTKEVLKYTHFEDDFAHTTLFPDVLHSGFLNKWITR